MYLSLFNKVIEQETTFFSFLRKKIIATCQMDLLVLLLLRVSMVMLVLSEKATTKAGPTRREAAVTSPCSRTEDCLSTHRQEDLCCLSPSAEQQAVLLAGSQEGCQMQSLLPGLCQTLLLVPS